MSVELLWDWTDALSSLSLWEFLLNVSTCNRIIVARRSWKLLVARSGGQASQIQARQSPVNTSFQIWEQHKLAFYDSLSVRQRFSRVLLTPTGFPTDKADLSTSVSVLSKIFRSSSLLAAIVSQFISIRHGARTDESSGRRSHGVMNFSSFK